MCDDANRLWGNPWAAYLSPDTIADWPELTGCAMAAVPGRDKLRVEWPPLYAKRTRAAVRPSALLFLTREHRSIRPVPVDEAVHRCESDFAAGKRDAEVLARVQADVVRQFAGLTLLEVGLGPDLEANLTAIRAELQRAG
jgi:hypothetical protein